MPDSWVGCDRAVPIKLRVDGATRADREGRGRRAALQRTEESEALMAGGGAWGMGVGGGVGSEGCELREAAPACCVWTLQLRSAPPLLFSPSPYAPPSPCLADGSNVDSDAGHEDEEGEVGGRLGGPNWGSCATATCAHRTPTGRRVSTAAPILLVAPCVCPLHPSLQDYESEEYGTEESGDEGSDGEASDDD